MIATDVWPLLAYLMAETPITVGQAILIVIGAVVTAVAGYMVAHLRNSGKIATSEASDLWKEGQSIRRELREEVAELREHVTRLESENATLREEVAFLKGGQHA